MITYSPYYLIELRKRLGAKLKSLVLPLKTSGYVSNIANKTVDNNELKLTLTTGSGSWYSILLRVQSGSTADVFRAKENHKYFFHFDLYSPKENNNNLIYILDDSFINTYDLKIGNNSINKIVNGGEGGSFSICLNLGNGNYSVNDELKLKNFFILDLTASKLDTLTAQQVYDLLTLNGTDFTNIELLSAGYEIKLGSFKSQDNAIANSKYGFIKLKDISDISYDSSNTRFILRGTFSNKPTQSSTDKPNMFCSKYVVVSNSVFDYQTPNNSIRSATTSNIFYVRNTNHNNVADFKNSLNDDDILVYELNTSLGNKLDNYTAEQVYYMFFATLGMSKMYVPYGKRFESSDNIILGTKYGIIDLGEPTWYKYTRGSNWIFYATIPNGKRYGDINGLNVDYWLNSSKWKINQKTNNGGGTASGEDLQVFWDASNSQLLIKDMSFTDGGGNIKNYLKGCYLVYPLAEPNGTDYNDLTAKQMYDMLNTNKIDVIADGKSVGGVRSLLGVQNIPLTITNDDANIRVASKNNSFSSSYAEGKLFSVIANHKYFVCYYGYFQNNVPDGFALVKYENNAPSTLGSVYANQTGFTLEKGKAYGGIILVGESTSNALLANRYWAGITDWHFYTKGDVIEGAVVIDLTEHNLQNLTAQEAYQYFKENNLNILDNRGEIDIGGYIKS